MRHHILFATCALALIATTAQANSDLFPELKKEVTPVVETPVQEKDVKLFEDNVGLNLDTEQHQELIDGATEEDIEAMAQSACYGDGRGGYLGGFVKLDKQAVADIYRLAL